MLKSGIVILNYNDASTTKHLVKMIEEYESINNIVIVDNCSTDNSYNILKNLRTDKIDVIQSEKNGGYAYGNNYGSKHLINKYNINIIFIANPDVEFGENITTEILEIFQNQNYALLSGVMYNLEGKISETPAWPVPTFKDDLIGCFILLSKLNKRRNRIVVKQKTPIVDVGVLPGSFFAIRAEVLKEIDYFDEGTFLFCEERILAKKMLDKGYRAGLVTGLSYYHIHGSSIGKIYKAVNSKRIIYESRLYYQKKYIKINKCQEMILKICMKISLIEFRIYLQIKKRFSS